MKQFDRFESRLTALDQREGCPHCGAVEALSEEEHDVRLQRLLNEIKTGCFTPDDLPAPSASCTQCQRHAAMSEDELDKELARLIEILECAKP